MEKTEKSEEPIEVRVSSIKAYKTTALKSK
jgi:hypothetical protein